METTEKGLGASIARTVALFLAFQIALFLAFAIPANFEGWLYAAFFAIAVPFHIGVFAFLYVLRPAFKIEETGVRLNRVNLANKITIARITTLPTVLVLILAALSYQIQAPLLALIALTFATDFLDGYVSRTRHEVTRMGKILDSTSDYCLLTVLTVSFWLFGLIPDWFVLAVIVRLGFQTIAVAVVYFAKKKLEPRSTLFGKVAIATVMLLYAAELARAFFSLGSAGAFFWIEAAAAAIVLASIADKVYVLWSELAGKAKPEGATSPSTSPLATSTTSTADGAAEKAPAGER